jgi:hypothetical protein
MAGPICIHLAGASSRVPIVVHNSKLSILGIGIGLNELLDYTWRPVTHAQQPKPHRSESLVGHRHDRNGAEPPLDKRDANAGGKRVRRHSDTEHSCSLALPDDSECHLDIPFALSSMCIRCGGKSGSRSPSGH